MANKFFNAPQLGGANLTQAAQTNETGVDNNANAQAQQANRGVDFLLNMAGSATQIYGKYQQNLEAKGRLESQREIPFYVNMMQKELEATENLDSMGRDALNSKFDEVTEKFIGMYEGKPYNQQLRDDIESMRSQVLTQMISKRDALHVQKVSDATSERASSLGEQFASGTIGEEDLRTMMSELMSESSLAHQVGSSTELDLPDDMREKYQGLTKQQARDAILKGLMIQTGRPKNSKVANILASEDFREMMGVSSTDEDYNKLVAHAFKKGEKADKLVYEQGMTSFKEQLYNITNQGIPVNIDMEIEGFKNSGRELTAQDEHKLRKEFKSQNDLVTNASTYISNLKEGKDVTARMEPKQQQEVYNRAFTDVLGITESGASIGNISGSLGLPENQQAFKDYIQSGGKIPKDVIGLFDVPAGAGVDKWNQANEAIMSMEVAAAGSGYSIESLIGVNQVSKVRGLSKLLNDDNMDEATKKNAIEAFHTQSTSFNSKGYLAGTQETKIDTEWLSSVSKDAPWTTDDYVSDLQNADEIAGNYQAYRLAGHDESTAQKMALDLFKESNTNFEMPNGGEIVIPRDHVYLNNESILAFAKDASRFPSIQEQRDDIALLTGDTWISEWRADRNISIQKSYNFAKTGKYDMLFDGKLVKDSSFTYEELQDFISNTDYKTREKITGVKGNRPFKEVEAEALENRKKKIKNIYKPDYRQNIFDLKI